MTCQCRHREEAEVQLQPTVTSDLEGGGWSAPHPGRFTARKDPVPIVQGAVWVSGPFWRSTENLCQPGIRSSHRPHGSESLYRPAVPVTTLLYEVWLVTVRTFEIKLILCKPWRHLREVEALGRLLLMFELEGGEWPVLRPSFFIPY
jgi:hypothetical protein